MNIRFRGLGFGFSGMPVFSDFSLELQNNDFPAVFLGPSGCGKTTLLRLIAGLLPPATGSVTVDAEAASGQPANSPGPSVSFVFQEPRLLPWLTVEENVSLPLTKLYGRNGARIRALDFLELVALKEKASALPRELSGGQQQRAAIARAFAYPAPLLLLDEPFHSLDIPLRIELMELTLGLLERENRAAAAVTHEPREAVYLANRIIVLGKPPAGTVYDRKINLSPEERAYGSAVSAGLEGELVTALSPQV
jgi:NitT/TauT family transport system ATP-binding protein